jgi:DUSAM domain-containing protein
MRPEPGDWENLKALYEDLQRTGSVEGTPEHFDLVRRVAGQVAIPDDEAEQELQRPDGLSRLITEIRKRIREGSQRLMRAMYDAKQRLDAGDRAGARQVLDEALADEVVPFYREIAKEESRVLGV